MPVNLTLNNDFLDQVVVQGDDGHYEVEVDGDTLQPGEINRLDLSLPEARNPSLQQLQQLGLRYAPHRLGLRDFTMQLVESTDPG
jgi:hypothetical protein